MTSSCHMLSSDSAPGDLNDCAKDEDDFQNRPFLSRTRPSLFPIARGAILGTHLARRFTRHFSKAPTPPRILPPNKPIPPMPSSRISPAAVFSPSNPPGSPPPSRSRPEPSLFLRGQNTTGKRLNIAVIGASGKGAVDTSKVALDHNIVALVDVDSVRLASAAKALEKRYCSIWAMPAPGNRPSFTPISARCSTKWR